MVRTGLPLNCNGIREECQFSDEIQQIDAKHRIHFDGEAVHSWEVETESDTTKELPPPLLIATYTCLFFIIENGIL